MSVVQLHVSITDQRLVLLESGKVQTGWSISTALAGAGEQNNSGCTPRGLHRIRLKIGANEPINRVFVGRRSSGEIYSHTLAQAFPNRDWILTRILWLQGLEWGRNRGGDVDSLRRYIYIHGTPDTEPMGTPRSHGCIRMRNTDLLELFDRVDQNTEVRIDD